MSVDCINQDEMEGILQKREFTKWHRNAPTGSRRTECVAVFPGLDPPTPCIEWRKRESESKELT